MIKNNSKFVIIYQTSSTKILERKFESCVKTSSDMDMVNSTLF